MERNAVIEKRGVWSGWAIFLAHVGVGMLTFVILVFVVILGRMLLRALPSAMMLGPVRLLVLGAVLTVHVFVPFFLLWRWRSHIRTSGRAALAGMGFGVGVGLELIPVFWNGGDVSWSKLGIGSGVVIIVFSLMNAVMMAGLLRWGTLLPVQDGMLCPGCAYCLRGVEGGVCPECGRAFTMGELMEGAK